MSLNEISNVIQSFYSLLGYNTKVYEDGLLEITPPLIGTIQLDDKELRIKKPTKFAFNLRVAKAHNAELITFESSKLNKILDYIREYGKMGKGFIPFGLTPKPAVSQYLNDAVRINGGNLTTFKFDIEYEPIFVFDFKISFQSIERHELINTQIYPLTRLAGRETFIEIIRNQLSQRSPQFIENPPYKGHFIEITEGSLKRILQYAQQKAETAVHVEQELFKNRIKTRLKKELDLLETYYSNRIIELTEEIGKHEKLSKDEYKSDDYKTKKLHLIHKLQEEMDLLTTEREKKRIDLEHTYDISTEYRLASMALIYAPVEIFLNSIIHSDYGDFETKFGYNYVTRRLLPSYCQCGNTISEMALNVCSKHHLVCDGCTNNCHSCKIAICQNCGSFCNYCNEVYCDDHIGDHFKTCAICQKLACIKENLYSCPACEREVCKSECIHDCITCHDQFCTECLTGCEICDRLTCPNHTKTCDHCKKKVCKDHYEKCDLCGRKFCSECMIKCSACEKTACIDCKSHCDECEAPICLDHKYICTDCGKTTCPTHTIKCKTCGNDFCQDCLGKCKVCKEPICKKCSRICEISKEFVCSEDILTCTLCQRNVGIDLVNDCDCKKHICTDCAIICAKEWHKTMCIDCLVRCSSCKSPFCSEHTSPCHTCWKNICEDCTHKCIVGAELLCKNCVNICPICNQIVCKEHLNNCLNCYAVSCANCLKECKICKKSNCPECSRDCFICGEPHCKEHLRPCPLCLEEICPDDLKRCGSCEQLYCDYHFVLNKCTTCRSMKPISIFDIPVHEAEYRSDILKIKKWKTGKNKIHRIYIGKTSRYKIVVLVDNKTKKQEIIKKDKFFGKLVKKISFKKTRKNMLSGELRPP